jgi:CheY-like chemotaxis protein
MRVFMSTVESTGTRILVVDDVAEVLDAIEKLLRADGYAVDAARSEDRAIECAQCKPPHLILINLDAARDELVALALRIRARAQLAQQVPIVIFCVDWVDAGQEIDLHDNVYATRVDNFNQLRRFIARLLQAPSCGA